MNVAYFTPGPSELYSSVPGHLINGLEKKIFSLSHRSKNYQAIYREAENGIRNLMGIPSSHSIVFLSSATEAMERILQGCVEKCSFHFVNGAFSERFLKISRELGNIGLETTVALGEGFKNLENFKIPKEAEIICLTQNETSTGVSIPEIEIVKLCKNNPSHLVALDVVSSAPYSTIPFEFVDCIFFSVQKCFGLPAGLGVLILSERALRKALSLKDKGISIGSYHSLISLHESGLKAENPETPNVLNIYLLSKVSKEYYETGIENIRSTIEQRAERIYSLIEESTHFEPFVKDSCFRSKTVITVLTHTKALEVREYLKQTGIEVGSGYKQFKDSQIRIANFLAPSDRDFERLLKALKRFPK